MSCAILTESLKCNWRSIEEMERNSLYEVLAHILKAKQHLLTRSVMNILLELVGKSRSDTE